MSEHLPLSNFESTPGESLRSIDPVTANQLGRTTMQTILSVEAGSLPPSWNARAASSDYAVSSGDRMSRAGSVSEVGMQNGLSIDEVLIASPINPRAEAQFRAVKDMDEDERAMHRVSHVSEGTHVRFNLLTPEAKYSVLSGQLYKVEKASQDAEARTQSSTVNTQRAESGVVVQSGEYLHGFNALKLRNILNTGLVAGELVGHTDTSEPQTDAYPFNLDVWDADIVGAVGENGKLEVTGNVRNYGDVIAVVARSDDTKKREHDPIMPSSGKKNVDDLGGPGHKLIFAGVPSTEIRALQLQPIATYLEPGSSEYEAYRSAHISEMVANVTNTLVAEGMYIPVYDDVGKLVFTQKEYAARREAGDYKLPEVEVPETNLDARAERLQAENDRLNQELEDMNDFDFDWSEGGV